MGKAASDHSGRWREILGFTLLAFTTLLFLALVTDGYLGESRRPLNGDMAGVPNALGVAGAVTAGVLGLLVGPAGHVLYFVTCVWALMLIRHRPLDWFPLRLVGMVLLTGSIAGMLHVDLQFYAKNPVPGGAVGAFVGEHLTSVFGVVGANVITGLLMIIGILLSTEFLFFRFFLHARGLAVGVSRGLAAAYKGGKALWLALVESERKRRRPFREVAQRILASLPPEEDAPHESTKQDPTAIRKLDLFERPSDTTEPLLQEIENLSRIRVVTAPPLCTWGEENHPQRGAPEAGQESTRTNVMELARHATRTESHYNQKPPGTPEIDASAEGTQIAADMEHGENSDEFTPFNVLVNEEEIDEDLSGCGETETPRPTSPLPEATRAAESGPSEGEDDVPIQLALPSVTGGKQTPKKPQLRCRTAPQDDLPPDYEYPKQYTKPPLSLFDKPRSRVTGDIEEQFRQTGARLEETLRTFGIEATVTDVLRGPTITRFELQPAPGIKVSRFHSLADDIALALKAQGVRVEAPIPGKGRIGIEVPNKKREPVIVRELFDSETFQKGDERLRLALGKDIAGDVIKTDLTAMPHLLVAGATGAGKTVCIKTFLASLLVTATPEEVQLILIDPKMVELSIFNDIPHLITPVVTDPKKASTALNWLINEMEERYRLFAHLRVRNIEVYNERVENGEIEMIEPDGENAGAITVNRKLPYIVCIIDELADLMMLARAEVEDAIARLAQLARATGIHLIIATQRPSVDVLTGVIKANFPARMSFQVSSRVDSRCILDEIGAERLIGKGDMLYLPAGRSKPIRIQGAFVSDHEMEALIAYLKTQAPPQYRDEIERFGQSTETKEDLLDESDELFNDAVRVVLETGQASISMVQRRLRVGYTRAARLIDMMELKGIVGPHTGSKARDILVSVPQKTDEVA
jgi:DNA segregation ATPase FtsK/SpoIIIE-like protein